MPVSNDLALQEVSSLGSSTSSGTSPLVRNDTGRLHAHHKRYSQNSDINGSRFSVDRSDQKEIRTQRNYFSKGNYEDRERRQKYGKEDNDGYPRRDAKRSEYFRSQSRSQGASLRRAQGELGGYLYDNYKPKLPSPKPVATHPTPQLDSSFDIVESLRAAFPHVKSPTSIQTRLIPAIIQGHDVLLMDETGSGKTFGSVIALISELNRPHTGTTTLYIVPHRDLAYQIESWCQQLLSVQPSNSTTPSSFVQVLARPDVTPELFNSIRKRPPRILIATPSALLDALRDRRLFLHRTLRRIVVDEVDAVMKIPMRYHKVQMRNQHRPEAAQAIDWLLRSMFHERVPKPQMVMMSATLQVHVRSWLFSQRGWMSEQVVRLNGIKEKIESDEFNPSHRSHIVHSAVVVEAGGTLRNMQDESGERNDLESEGDERGILTRDPEDVLTIFDGADRPMNAATAPSRPIKGLTLPPSVLEAIATSVALDVSNRALLVVSNGVSVIPVVESLKSLGVQARLLDFREEIGHVSCRPEPEGETEELPDTSLGTGKGATSSKSLPLAEPEDLTEEFSPNPTLLVTTSINVRGIDIPTLSHVYIVGGLESNEAYRHIAGRAGRFGMPGTVVSFVGAQGAESLVGGSTGERRLQRIYRQIGAQRVPFPHIQ